MFSSQATQDFSKQTGCIDLTVVDYSKSTILENGSIHIHKMEDCIDSLAIKRGSFYHSTKKTHSFGEQNMASAILITHRYLRFRPILFWRLR
jgi:arsenate reductase-like glutaredoxin family protein